MTAVRVLSLQYHELKVETICVLSGEGVEHGPTADELTSRVLTPADTIHLPSTTVHRMTAVTDLVFVDASTADVGWREDVVRLEEIDGRTGTTAP